MVKKAQLTTKKASKLELVSRSSALVFLFFFFLPPKHKCEGKLYQVEPRN